LRGGREEEKSQSLLGFSCRGGGLTVQEGKEDRSRAVAFVRKEKKGKEGGKKKGTKSTPYPKEEKGGGGEKGNLGLYRGKRG